MAKQYNSEIEKELHLLRLSNERIEKHLKELFNQAPDVISMFEKQLVLMREANERVVENLQEVLLLQKEVKSAKKGST